MKNSGGSERIRIMVAASTERFSFEPIRVVSRDFTDPNTIALTVAQTMKIAMPRSARPLPDASTSENSTLFSHGVSMPIPVTAIIDSTSSAMSPGEICWMI